MTNLFRNLSIQVRLGAILLILVCLSALNYFAISYFVDKQKYDSAVVDAAGRQRMLSQKIAFLSELVAKGEAEMMIPLMDAVELHEISLKGLMNGGVVPGIAHERPLPAADNEMLPLVYYAETYWRAYKDHCETLISTQKALVTGALPDSEIGITQRRADMSLEYIESAANEMLIRNDRLVKGFVEQNAVKQAALDKTLMLLLLGNIPFALLGFWIIRVSIKSPIKSIQHTAHEMAHGRLDTPLMANRGDEFGLTVEYLNQLMCRLRNTA